MVSPKDGGIAMSYNIRAATATCHFYGHHRVLIAMTHPWSQIRFSLAVFLLRKIHDVAPFKWETHGKSTSKKRGQRFTTEGVSIKIGSSQFLSLLGKPAEAQPASENQTDLHLTKSRKPQRTPKNNALIVCVRQTDPPIF